MRSLFVFLFVIGLAIAPNMVAEVSAQEDTRWDTAICSGSESVVWRVVDGTTDNLPEVEGCDPDDSLGWLITEPWSKEKMNPDRACFAPSWTDVVEVAKRLEWENGSAWRVNADIAENPLVVLCDDVATDAQLGLNPGESQLELRLVQQTIARAAILLSRHGLTMSGYAAMYPEHPISELFILLIDLDIAAGE